MTANPMSFRFGSRLVGDGMLAFVIAEIGVNHEGDAELACRMVEAAVAAGADAIKLQTADPDENYAPDTPAHALYRQAFIGAEETARVFDCARRLGAEPFTTTGLKTLEWIERLQPSGYKISSGTLTNVPLVRAVSRTARPVLMSTGIATHADITEAIDAATSEGATDIGLMQCTSIYPCPDEFVDLASISWMRAKFGRPVGFSDHTRDADTAGFAVAAGAAFVEKHFSLTPERESFDHQMSLDPSGFRAMVAGIRRAETLLGARDKPLRSVEAAKRMRRCIVAVRSLEAGHVLQPEDIGFMRANNNEGGLPPKDFEQVIGARLRAAVPRFAPLTVAHVELRTPARSGKS